MNWMLNIGYLVIFTTISGSLVTLLWSILGRILERAGFLNISYDLMRIVMVFWLCPVSYISLNYLDVHSGRWGGDLFLGTPGLHRAGCILFFAWLAGVLISLMKYISGLSAVAGIRRSVVPCEKDVQSIFSESVKHAGILRTVRMGQSCQVTVPQLTGCFRPVVILSVRAYEPAELRVIFAHELTHVRHQDILMKNLAVFVRMVHFMNPVAWWFVKVSDQWSEFACDYEVCRQRKNLKQYYTVILDMVEELSAAEICVSRLTENKSKLRERMERVMKCYKKKKRSGILAAILLAGIVASSAGAVFTSTVKAADVLRNANDRTAVEIMEEPDEIEIFTEYVETESDPSVKVYEGEVSTNARSSFASFDWIVYPNSLTRTAEIRLNKGEQIDLTIANSSDGSFSAGIITPSGTKRYVSGTTYISHTFLISQTGNYRGYVQNPGNTSISVSGGYLIH